MKQAWWTEIRTSVRRRCDCEATAQIITAAATVVLAGVTAWLVCKTGETIRQSKEQFELERRPWLVASLPFIVVDTGISPVPEADTAFDTIWVTWQLQNVGGGAASSCRVVSIRLDSVGRLDAECDTSEHLANPTFPLPPGDTRSSTKPLAMGRRGSIDTSQQVYVRLKVLYKGCVTADTFYYEQTFFLRPHLLARTYNLGDTIVDRNVGHEATFYGRVKGGLVKADN